MRRQRTSREKIAQQWREFLVVIGKSTVDVRTARRLLVAPLSARPSEDAVRLASLLARRGLDLGG